MGGFCSHCVTHVGSGLEREESPPLEPTEGVTEREKRLIAMAAPPLPPCQPPLPLVPPLPMQNPTTVAQMGRRKKRI